MYNLKTIMRLCHHNNSGHTNIFISLKERPDVPCHRVKKCKCTYWHLSTTDVLVSWFFGWYWLITDITVLVYTFWKWLFFTGNYAKKEAWCISYLLNPQWSLSCQCTDVSFNKTVYCQTVKDPALITYLWSISFRRSPLKKVYGILYF